MRLGVVCLLFVLGAAGVANAEKVKTNQSTKVYAGPGEQKKILLELRSGQSMTLLEQDGRWLKVRVQGRTGYVPRSKVDMPEEGEIVRNTRRRPFVDGRSRKRGFGGEAGPDDRVGADALRDAEEDESEEEEDEEPKRVVKKAKPAPVEEEEEEEPKRPAKKSKPIEPERVAAASKSVDEEDEEPSGDEEAEGEPTKTRDEDDENPVGGRRGKGDEDEAEKADKRPTARVAKKVSALDDADSEALETFVARPSDTLYALGSRDGWTEVENEEGDTGWIRTDDLELEGGGGGGGSSGRRPYAINARLGMMVIQQGLRSQGAGVPRVPDNYNVLTPSLTVSLGGSYMKSFGPKYLLGVEAAYDYAKTVTGGVIYDPDGGSMPMPPVTTGLTIHNVNARALLGLKMGTNGTVIFGRLGYRYQGYLVDNYADAAKNPARIPQEVMKAPTLGVGLTMPRLTNTLGLRLALDTSFVATSLEQTEGLEDGGAPAAKAATLGAALTYKLNGSVDLMLSYDLRYTGVDFGAPVATSLRGHMGTSVSRTDTFHAIAFGVGF